MNIVLSDLDGCMARGMARALEAGLYELDGQGLIAEFESAAATLFPPGYVAAAGSGTSAASELYWALGLGPGDEVLVPAYGFHATVLPLLRLGVVPRFVDVDETGSPGLESIAAAWTPRCRALVWTHLWGPLADLADVAGLVHERGGMMIADCSHSLATSSPALLAGEHCDGAFASLNQLKPLGVGEGGVSWVPERRVHERIIAFGHSGARGSGLSNEELRRLAETGLGMKNRITVVAAAIGTERIAALETMRERRWTQGSTFARLLAETGTAQPLFPSSPASAVAFHHVALAIDWTAAQRAEGVAALVAADLPVIRTPSTRPFSQLPVVREASHWFPHLPPNWAPDDELFRGAELYQRRLLLFAPEDLTDPRAQAAVAEHLLQTLLKTERRST